MLTAKQVKEIKEHLEKAQNPVFFFDNDPDGLCSFLLLQGFIGRGKGVPIRSFPSLTGDYFRKIHELNADYIFILDKPLVSKEFFSEVEKENIPVVWIDHHQIQTEIPKFVNYFNPTINKTPSNEPVTALCYQIANKKEDLWLAVVGCIADHFLPKFYSELEKNYPELIMKSNDSFEVLYKSQIGRISKILNFGLKDSATNVVTMMKYLMKVKGPYDILDENQHNYIMHYRFNHIENRYHTLLEKATELGNNSEKILFFQYAGDLSISGELSNELSFKFPKKIIVVAYISGVKANISARGKKIRDKILEAIKDLPNSTGGGHEDAVGAQVKIEDIEKFRDNLEKIIGK